MLYKQDKSFFYCGTSNVELPVANKSHFPVEFQDKSRLHYYATLFNTVEINRSFYKIPMKRTVEKWAADVPPDFKFSFKLWKGITHAPQLRYDLADLHKYIDAISGAGTKIGCLLLQFPAGIKSSCFQKLKTLLHQIKVLTKSLECRVAVEFRDVSWYNGTVYELINSFGATVVIHDMPKSVTPPLPVLADLVYIRFHGEKGDYKGSYADDVLAEQCKIIKAYIKRGTTVFAYFNNTIGSAVDNALMLKKMYFNRH